MLRLKLHLAEGCNLACGYCYQDKPTGTGTLMSVETYRRATEAFADRGFELYLYGGEPLLNRAIFDLLMAEGLPRGASGFSMTTNGTLLDDRTVSFLESVRGVVDVSFDGTRAQHDRNRKFSGGGGSFDAIVRNLARFKDKRCVSLACTVNPATAGNLAASAALFMKLGYRRTFNFVYEADWGRDALAALARCFAVMRAAGTAQAREFWNEIIWDDAYSCHGHMLEDVTVGADGSAWPCSKMQLAPELRGKYGGAGGQVGPGFDWEAFVEGVRARHPEIVSGPLPCIAGYGPRFLANRAKIRALVRAFFGEPFQD